MKKPRRKPRYSIIVGETFRTYTGTSACTGLTQHALAYTRKEMEKKLARAFDEFGLATAIDLETGLEPSDA